MDPERWERIEQLYNEALDRRPEERSSFLAEACRGDEEMRREVDSLLDHLEKDRAFLSSPAVNHILDNELLAHYRIVRKLAAGGMGEVYQASDTKLKRDVAIKILPVEFSRDPERVSRFQREAEVLASLNHPNIATIHGVEEARGLRFLVMELVDGETLAERIARGAVPIDETLDIAKGICEALEAAHEPSNHLR